MLAQTFKELIYKLKPTQDSRKHIYNKCFPLFNIVDIVKL